MAVHSQTTEIPKCPDGWGSLWLGYSFAMVRVCLILAPIDECLAVLNEILGFRFVVSVRRTPTEFPSLVAVLMVKMLSWQY